MPEEFSLQLHHKWLARNTWQQLLYEIQTDRFMRCIKFFQCEAPVTFVFKLLRSKFQPY